MIKLNELFQHDKNRVAHQDLEPTGKEMDKLALMAQKCLDSTDFVVYRKQFERVEASMIDSIITYTKAFVESDSGDTTKYALNMVRIITRFQDLRSLLKRVETDSKRKSKVKEDLGNAS